MSAILIAAAVGLAMAGAAAAYAATHRFEMLLLVGRLMRPKVEPNREIIWQAGPDRPPPGDRPPNVIVILIDDMGFNDVSFNGGGVAGGRVPTPNIDSIGRDGVSFANGYAANATCAPSRASLMTGRYSTRIGYEFTPTPRIMPQIIASFDDGSKIRPQYLSDADKAVPREALSVPADEVFVSQILKDRGYHTIHIGKWHLGQHRGVRPLQKGFDESLGTVRHGSVYLPEGDKRVVNAKQPWDVIDRCMWTLLPYQVEFNDSKMFEPKGYATDYFTDEAVKAIKANRNQPFFLYFAPNAIHSPLQALKEDVDALPPEIEGGTLRVYGAMVRNLDRNVGRILQAVKDEGLEEDTLVIFSSDNGGAGYLGLPDINKPYRGWKITYFEGGVHVPFFIKWPRVIAAGTRYPHPVSLIDVLPTVVAAAGAALPEDRVIDGVDLTPYVTGRLAGRPHETLFWRSGQYKCVLDGEWKLQSCEALGKVWLYHLANDPTEQVNLSELRPDKVEALKALLARQDAQAATPLWPSVLRAPIAIDHTSDRPLQEGQEYILWDN